MGFEIFTLIRRVHNSLICRQFATLIFLHCVETDQWPPLNCWLQWFDDTIGNIKDEEKKISKDIERFKQNNKAFVR